MPVSGKHRGWFWDAGNSRLAVYVDGTEVARFDDATRDLALLVNGLSVVGGLAVTTGAVSFTVGPLGVDDDVSIELGTDDDSVLRHRASTLAANTALTDVLVGTPASAATPANSLLISNVTADGDIAFFTRNAAGANSIEGLRFDASAGLVVFNEAAADLDFRVEGDTNANMILMDAAQDALSLGGANVDGAAVTFNNTTTRTAITAVGHQIHIPTQTTNFDNASSTVAVSAAVNINIPTYTGDTATLTLTDAATLRIAGVPVASTNVTITNTPSALWVVAGQSRFGGSVLSESATAGIGYMTGAGGTVTQMTNKTTGVTLNTVTGTITLNNASLAGDTTASFVLTDSAIAATDAVIVLHESAGTLGAYSFASTAGAGSATIAVHNNTPGALGEAIVLRFVVIKSVNA